MKFFAAISFILVAASAVGAIPTEETNAKRLARGLNPLPPQRRATGVKVATRHFPSSIPSVCARGSNLKCCFSLKRASEKEAKFRLVMLGINNVDPDSTVGLACGHLSSFGLNNGWCRAKAACCENDYLGGIISTGCTRVNK